MKLTENFVVEEVMDSELLADLRQKGIDPRWLLDEQLFLRLEQIRKHFNAPVIITSGYRSQAKNYLAKGKDYSQHLFGRGVDFVVEGIAAEVVQAYCRNAFVDGGLGKGKDFTHLDTRWSDYLVEWEYPS